MSQVEQLITDNLDVWTSAIKKRGSQGRGSSKKIELYGIKKLRELILELAVRGLLVPQDPNDEAASSLLEKVAAEKEKLIKEGKVKRQKALPDISEDEKPFGLPTGWSWVRLGDLVEMYNGRAFKSSEWVTAGLPIVRIQNLNNASAEFNYYEGSIEDHHRIDNGSFLISWSGTPGTSFGAFIWNRGQAALNQHINNCIFHFREMNLAFMRLAVNGCMNHFISMAQGAVGLKHVTKGTLNNAVIAFPPETEQPRIVAKVDELMALCDQLEQQSEDSLIAHQTLVETLLNALLDAAQSRDDSSSKESAFDQAWQRIAEHFDVLFTTEHSIDQLKQAILQLAVMGKLVPQVPNDEPAIMLLEKIAAEKERLVKEGRIKKQKPLTPIGEDEIPFSLPASWEWVKIKDLIEPMRDISYGVIKLEAEPPSGGISILRCSDVKPRYLDLNGVRRVSEEIEEPYKRTRLEGGEVLVNVRGTLGGVALVPDEIKGFNIAREVAMLAFLNVVDGRYAVDMIASPFFWDMISENLKGIAYKGLNLNTLRELPFPLPPISEQRRIVEKVGALMALCNSLKVGIRESQTTQLHFADVMAEQALS